jgi:hypothetical protein
MNDDTKTGKPYVAFRGFEPLPYTIDKTLTPALLYVFDQPLTVIEANKSAVK